MNEWMNQCMDKLNSIVRVKVGTHAYARTHMHTHTHAQEHTVNVLAHTRCEQCEHLLCRCLQQISHLLRAEFIKTQFLTMKSSKQPLCATVCNAQVRLCVCVWKFLQWFNQIDKNGINLFNSYVRCAYARNIHPPPNRKFVENSC